MRLLLYAKNDDCYSEKLQAAGESVVSKEEIEVIYSIEHLSEMLMNAPYKDTVAVLITEKRDELFQLNSILGLLRKARVILILPDREPETVSIGYKLEPRFLSYIDSDVSEVSAVLNKML